MAVYCLRDIGLAEDKDEETNIALYNQRNIILAHGGSEKINIWV